MVPMYLATKAIDNNKNRQLIAATRFVIEVRA